MHSGKTPDAGCTPDSWISTNSIGQSLAASVLDASWTDTMAFSFGSTTTTPSPAVGSSTGSFSFGGFGSAGTNAAPSSTTGFSFGGAAPGTTAGGSIFGTPAPTGNTLFGQASSGYPGGSSTANAPASAGGGLFGSPAPAPLGQYHHQPYPQLPPPAISGKMRYADLPPQYRTAIDTIYQGIQQHKRTMLQVQSSGPAGLPVQQSASTLNGADPSSLKPRVQHLQAQLDRLQNLIRHTAENANQTLRHVEDLTQASYLYAKWPTEAIAVRRGCRLSTLTDIQPQNEEKKENSSHDATYRLREILDMASVHVDRIERMPSPFFWHLLHEFETRFKVLQDQVNRTNQQLDTHLMRNVISVTATVDDQHRALWGIGEAISQLRSEVEELRQQYARFERPGENVVEKAALKEWQRKKRLEDQIKRVFVQVAQPLGQPTTPSTIGTASAPGYSSTFGASTAPGTFGTASGTSSFFGTASPAPAPFGSAPGAFGSFTAPAAPLGSSSSGTTPASFGSSTAQAPSTFSFAAPAPNTGSFGFGGTSSGATTTTTSTTPFGSTTAPVPSFGSTGGISSATAPGASSFNWAAGSSNATTTTTAPPITPLAPKKSSKSSRSSSRLRR